MSTSIGGRHVAIRSIEEPQVAGPRHGRRRVRPARPARRVALVAGVSAVAVLAGGGVAYAYWTAGGGGAGSTTIGTVSLAADPVTASGLYPGRSIPVTVDITATGDGTVSVTAINPAAAEVSVGLGPCDPAAVTFTTTAGLPQTVSAGAPVTVAGTVTMALDAADGCQGRTFTIPLTVEGRLP